MSRIILLLLFGVSSILSNAQVLSENAQISVITLEPGTEELFAGFGHSVFRVVDSENNIDWAYSYGTFNFEQPNFYLNYAKGYMFYSLSVSNYTDLKRVYKSLNRSIVAQVLALTQSQKQALFDFLKNNALPENRGYYYDYFYDNCATKIRDVIEEVLGENFKLDPEYLDNPGLTIRQLTDSYIKEEFPWGKLGIDLCLGTPMDKVLTSREYMFLPDYIYSALNAAQIRDETGWHKAVLRENIVFESKETSAQDQLLFTPKLVFWLLFLIVLALTILQYKKGINLKALDVALFLIVGLFGIFIGSIWLFTNHVAAANNMNILWALPLHAVAVLFIFKKTKPTWWVWYWKVVWAGTSSLVILWSVLPQAMNAALIPLAMTILMRAYMLFKFEN